jgi:hypothetical protein
MRILNGWKQIAAHLNQGVRTVQRWEVIGLPVHRLRGTNSPVIAFAEELNDWAEHAQFDMPIFWKGATRRSEISSER